MHPRTLAPKENGGASVCESETKMNHKAELRHLAAYNKSLKLKFHNLLIGNLEQPPPD